MDKQLKELHETLAQLTMYSKMGKYISNKILKYNKRVKTRRSYRNTQFSSHQYLPLKKSNSIQPSTSSYVQAKEHKIKNCLNETQPPVGYYKVNFSQIQKNPRVYNFNRSVPHFNRDKYICHEVKPVLNQYPQSALCQYRVKGLTQLKRVVGRSDIKGSVRKQIEDPHENRFTLIKYPNSVEFGRSPVNMSKQLPRNNAVFRNNSLVPEHDYQVKIPLKRLDTHIIPFDRILDRDEKAITCLSGISDFFNEHQIKNTEQKILNWKKMLPRQKTGLLPSYMDKNINTRSSINLLNLKTLEMNCSSLKQKAFNMTKKQKKHAYFMEQQGKNQTNQKQNIRWANQ